MKTSMLPLKLGTEFNCFFLIIFNFISQWKINWFHFIICFNYVFNKLYLPRLNLSDGTSVLLICFYKLIVVYWFNVANCFWHLQPFQVEISQNWIFCVIYSNFVYMYVLTITRAENRTYLQGRGPSGSQGGQAYCKSISMFI